MEFIILTIIDLPKNFFIAKKVPKGRPIKLAIKRATNVTRIDKKSISYNNFKEADLIIWDHDKFNVKVGAGRLIELIKSTLNKESIDNLHSSHALIITNKNNISYDDIIKISLDIQSKVYKEFNIHLEIEPTII